MTCLKAYLRFEKSLHRSWLIHWLLLACPQISLSVGDCGLSLWETKLPSAFLHQRPQAPGPFWQEPGPHWRKQGSSLSPFLSFLFPLSYLPSRWGERARRAIQSSRFPTPSPVRPGFDKGFQVWKLIKIMPLTSSFIYCFWTVYTSESSFVFLSFYDVLGVDPAG